MARIVVLAIFVIGAAAWALWNHYASPLPPLRRPVRPAAPAPTYDADAGELPAPDLPDAPPQR